MGIFASLWIWPTQKCYGWSKWFWNHGFSHSNVRGFCNFSAQEIQAISNCHVGTPCHHPILGQIHSLVFVNIPYSIQINSLVSWSISVSDGKNRCILVNHQGQNPKISHDSSQYSDTLMVRSRSCKIPNVKFVLLLSQWNLFLVKCMCLLLVKSRFFIVKHMALPENGVYPSNGHWISLNRDIWPWCMPVRHGHFWCYPSYVVSWCIPTFINNVWKIMVYTHFQFMFCYPIPMPFNDI